MKFRIEAVSSEYVKRFGGPLRKLFGMEIEKEVYGPLDEGDRRMIAPFKIKQRLRNKDERGDRCSIYGVTEGGDIIS